MNGDLMLNANVFYTKWTDQQITVQRSSASFDTETINAGESNIKGFETFDIVQLKSPSVLQKASRNADASRRTSTFSHFS